MTPRHLYRAIRYAVAGAILVATLAWVFWPRPVPVDVVMATRGPGDG
jgi:hypothetical protein